MELILLAATVASQCFRQFTVSGNYFISILLFIYYLFY